MSKAVYPWLLSIFPILHVYSTNLGGVREGEVLRAGLVSCSVTTVVFLVLWAATRSWHKSAVVTAALLVFFFSYGHIAMLVGSREWLVWGLAALAGLGGLGVLALWKLLVSREIEPWTRLFNLMGLILLVLPMIRIIPYWARTQSLEIQEILSINERPERVEKVPDDPRHPDIYYIIVDGYSSNNHLSRQWGYDNSAFTDALEELGFFVAYDSKSNYGTTLHSLASSLNMRYVPENAAGGNVDDVMYLRALIADSKVARIMIEEGYTYLHMLSGCQLPSSIADTSLDFFADGVREFDFRSAVSNFGGIEAIAGGFFFKEPFHQLLLSTTVLSPVSHRFEPEDGDWPLRWSDTRRFFDTLESLEAVPDMPQATFAFVHLLEPHAPVQFDRHGNKLAKPIIVPNAEQFFGELELVNGYLLETLRSVIERSATPPIIILQADHGSNLGVLSTGDELDVKFFEIMNAFYLPGDGWQVLERDISPINTFRVLLGQYFGLDYPEMEVRHFDVPKGYKAPFELTDLTEQFK